MLYPILISLSIGFVIGLLLFYLLSRKRGGFVSAGTAISPFSEKDVETLLKNYGYSILGKRQRETVITTIDGKDHFGYLEAEYTVKKNKKSYVVIVKTGEGTDDPNEPTLRRKLIEYNRVFRANGILFLKPHEGKIHEIRFRFPHEHNIDFFFRFLIGLFIILIVIAIIWMLVGLRLF